MFVRKKKKENVTWEELLEINKRKDSVVSLCYADIIGKINLIENNTLKKTLLITSANDLEGKTTTALNIASALSSRRTSTLLIDANFRDPTLGSILGGGSLQGLSDILADNIPQEKVIIRDKHLLNLSFLPIGTYEGNFVELLLSEKFKFFLEEIKSLYDHIIIDSSSVNRSLEPLVIGMLVDGVVLVVLCDKTQKEESLIAKNKIEEYGGKIIGVVLNKIPGYVPSLLKSR